MAQESGQTDIVQTLKAIVKIMVYDSDVQNDLQPYTSGSGVIINSSGIILTSAHVVQDKDVITQKDFPLGVQVCVPSDPAKEADCIYAAKLIAINKDLDIALLQIIPIEGLSTATTWPYIQMAATDTTQINDALGVFGYPGIGGDTITYTTGVVSGKVDKYGKLWLKTDATSSFGSSGGAVLDKSMKLVGITNAAQADYLGSLGYALSATSFTSWITSNLGNPATEFPLGQRVINFSKQQNEIKGSRVFSQLKPPLAISLPEAWEAKLIAEDEVYLTNNNDADGGYIKILWQVMPVKIDKGRLTADLMQTFFENRNIALATIEYKDITIGSRKAWQVSLRFPDSRQELYIVPTSSYLVTVRYGYGKENKDRKLIETAIQTLIIEDTPIEKGIVSYTNTEPKFTLAVKNPWIGQTFNDSSQPIDFLHKKYPEVHMRIQVRREDDDLAQKDSKKFLALLIEALDKNRQKQVMSDLEDTIIYKTPTVRLTKNSVPAVHWQLQGKSVSSKKVLYYSADYIFRVGKYEVDFEVNAFTSNKAIFNKALTDARAMIASFSFK